MYDLLSKYLAGECSQQEKQKLFEALDENPEINREAIDMQNLSALINMNTNDQADTDKHYQQFLRKRRQQTVVLYLKESISYAAVALLAVVFSYLMFNTTTDKPDMLYQAFSTPAGQRACVQLADGTEIWLNANSQLRYPDQFNTDLRMVELEGEAYFKVKSNPEKPFVVKTSKMDVRVLGTTFNVSAYPNDSCFTTSLLEGRVEVSLSDLPNQWHELAPNQQIAITDGQFKISSFNDTNFLAWKEGVFVFDDMLLPDIIKRLESFYAIRIENQNNTLTNYRYTGKFRQSDGVESIIRKLQIVYPFQYTKDDQKNSLTIR